MQLAMDGRESAHRFITPHNSTLAAASVGSFTLACAPSYPSKALSIQPLITHSGKGAVKTQLTDATQHHHGCTRTHTDARRRQTNAVESPNSDSSVTPWNKIE